MFEKTFILWKESRSILTDVAVVEGCSWTILVGFVTSCNICGCGCVWVWKKWFINLLYYYEKGDVFTISYVV